MFEIIMYQNCVVTVTFCMYQEHRSTKKNNSKSSLSHIFMQNWHIILEWFYMLISMFLSACTDYIDI